MHPQRGNTLVLFGLGSISKNSFSLPSCYRLVTCVMYKGDQLWSRRHFLLLLSPFPTPTGAGTAVKSPRKGGSYHTAVLGAKQRYNRWAESLSDGYSAGGFGKDVYRASPNPFPRYRSSSSTP